MADTQDFGTLRLPDRPATEYEKIPHLFPRSMQTLNKSTSEALNQYLKLTEGVLEIPKCLIDEFHILWLIDKNDDFIFALEEYIDRESYEPVSARGRNFPRTMVSEQNKNFVRLGHPALTTDLYAKIGGELNFVKGEWELSNASGRYGFGRDARPKHLENVRVLLKEHGIFTKTRYI